MENLEVWKSFAQLRQHQTMTLKDYYGVPPGVALATVAAVASVASAVATAYALQRQQRSPTATAQGQPIQTFIADHDDTKPVLRVLPPVLRVLPPVREGVPGLIGNTPMIRLKSLSEATGCTVLAKLEMQNPGGSAKDRVAIAVIQQAEAAGLIKPHSGDMVFEGTSGSTGISLAVLCNALGYTAHIALPDDTSTEKVTLLETLGAVVYKVRPASIIDDQQYVNYARRAAQAVNAAADKAEQADSTAPRPPRAVFADQFENECNWATHFDNTGPEIWAQTAGELDVFVTGAGTGGTISGVGRYLKATAAAQTPPRDVQIVVADPQGSGFYNKVKYNVMFSATEREGTRRRHQVDTVVEGIGLNRVTANFGAGHAIMDDAVRVSDTEALKMAKWLVQQDGLFVGSSSAVHCVGAYRCAKALGPGHTIVTIVCDNGARHLSKFWKAAQDVEITSLDDL